MITRDPETDSQQGAIAAPSGLSDFDERYIAPLLSAWRIQDQSERFQQRVLKVLQELGAEPLLSLVDPRFEVRILPDQGLSVWCFYPFYKTLYNARRFEMAPVPLVKPNLLTVVLLQFNSREFEKQDAARSLMDLRKHFGHALLWLRSPAAPNEDSDAKREWQACVREPAKKKAK
jgi:hypothetical protein